MRSRYCRACWYSCLKPNVVRSPEQTTMSGASSLISPIARSSRFGSKYGPPQWRSEMCAMRKTPSMAAVLRVTSAVRRGSGRARPSAVGTLLHGAGDPETPGSRHIEARSRRGSPTRSNSSAPRSWTSTAFRGSTSRTSFVLERDAEGRVTERVHAGLLPSGAGPLHRGDGDEAVARDPKEPQAARAPAAVPGRQGQALLPARHRAPGPATTG